MSEKAAPKYHKEGIAQYSSSQAMADPRPGKRRRIQDTPPSPHDVALHELQQNESKKDGSQGTMPSSSSPRPSQFSPKAEVLLDADQEEIVELICEKNSNVFLTGPAGVGKSVVIQVAVDRLQAQGKNVYKVAPTGIAAISIGGTTLDNYLGTCPDDDEKPLIHVTKSTGVKNARKSKVSKTDVLIIDEISMVSNFRFQRLHSLLASAKDTSKAFGGIQMIVTGDFCQLPPVKPFAFCWGCGKELKFIEQLQKYECEKVPAHGSWFEHDKWAFNSHTWQRGKFIHRSLKKVHRQKDVQFIDLLQKIRLGHHLSATEKKLLMESKATTVDTSSFRLYPKIKDVNLYNKQKYDGLHTAAHSYRCLDELGHPAPCDDPERILRLRQLQSHRYEANLQLKLDMPVVLLSNIDIFHGLVNGAQGTIVGFETYEASRLPRPEEIDEEAKPSIEETELEVDKDVPMLRGRFADYRGQQIIGYVNRLKHEDQCWPRVRFLNGEVHTIFPDCRVREVDCTVKQTTSAMTATADDRLDKPQHLLSRTQIPLTAGWALTVHKSQGMTLDRVVVDLEHAFERGQVYVALSRARTLDGLTILNWPKDPNHVFADKEVVNFMEKNHLI